MIESQGTSAQPAWLELPEAELQRHTYYSCFGQDKKLPFWRRLRGSTRQAPTALVMFYTAEEAETYAAQPNPFWEWNKAPAHKTTLKATMFNARRQRVSYVALKAYVNGSWQTVKRWPTDVPLLED